MPPTWRGFRETYASYRRSLVLRSKHSTTDRTKMHISKDSQFPELAQVVPCFECLHLLFEEGHPFSVR